jgi:hypothetical protein
MMAVTGIAAAPATTAATATRAAITEAATAIEAGIAAVTIDNATGRVTGHERMRIAAA